MRESVRSLGRLLGAALVRRGFGVWRWVVLTWLHVSDFHIRMGDSYDRDVVLGALVRSVRRFRERGRTPDVVFATGDIAFSGKPGEYETQTVFFDALLDAAGLGRRHLFVIAGNHDDRELGAGLARSLASREEADRYFAPGSPRPHLTRRPLFGVVRGGTSKGSGSALIRVAALWRWWKWAAYALGFCR